MFSRRQILEINFRFVSNFNNINYYLIIIYNSILNFLVRDFDSFVNMPIKKLNIRDYTSGRILRIKYLIFQYSQFSLLIH